MCCCMSAVATHKEDPKLPRAVSAAMVELCATFYEAQTLGRSTDPLRSTSGTARRYSILLPSRALEQA